MKKILLAGTLLGLAGCLSHIAPDTQPDHLKIGWQTDFETARTIADASHRPILVVMIAGDITDQC